MNQLLRETIAQLLEKTTSLLDEEELQRITDQIETLEQTTYSPEFWQLPGAKKTMRDIAALKQKRELFVAVQTTADDVRAILDLFEEETENQELLGELEKTAKLLEKKLSDLEITYYLSGKFDTNEAIISFHSGQGGTEAMDWAEMVQRMYTRYFDSLGWKYTLISESRGEEAGIKSAEYEVSAPYAYGYLKKEAGTHRLVRQSPFNADSLRQTSFALVEVLPLIDTDSDEVELADTDLQWHFTRAGGAGGQNVNKVNTAVELTHTPTNTTVRCREERSQVQNKERALSKLKSILAQQEAEALSKQLQLEKGDHSHASWGNQIRNYVLHPYQLVKDTRTQVQTSDAQAVLDGDLHNFIQAELQLP